MSKYYTLNTAEKIALSLAVGLSLLIFGAFIWAMIELFGTVAQLIINL